MNPRLRWRKFVSNFMLTMTGLCALIAVSVLFFILGLSRLPRRHLHQLEFLHEIACSRRRNRRRHGQCHLGSAKLLARPRSSVSPSVSWAPSTSRNSAAAKSLLLCATPRTCSMASPSIVIGIFAYSIAVHPFKHFSTFAGGFALGVMMIPITLRSTEEFLLGVPRTLREGAMALGASKWKTIATVVVPAAYRGILTAILLAFARVAGETAPLCFSRPWQSLLEPWLERAHRLASGHDLQLCHLRRMTTGIGKLGQLVSSCSR